MFFTKKEKLNLETLRDYFDAQKKTLLENGYPALMNMPTESFNAALESAWETLAEKIGTTEIVKRGNIPLLIVVQQGDLQEKMKKINGHTGLDLGNIKKSAENPSNPFSILLDVEDGQSMVAKSPKDALKKFEKENRGALAIDESIALLIHYPDLLKKHYLISAGSFYAKDNETLPLLWLLDPHGNPELHYAWFHIAHGSYGTASYAIKIS